ncbi:MAG: NAD-dependent epimerase/dehydratase family protein [Rhodocyclaceae bacterium]|nr:NAD-dependent epimerase/dehydratase family protein [Rhodocyclaceae bacterium]
MIVAVWGASGFVGTHLVDALLERGMKVRALGRDHAVWPASLRDRVDAVSLPSTATAADFRAALSGVSCVVHCAGTPGASPDELATHELGTRKLAEAAAFCGVGRLILVSTVAVYGQHGQELVGPETPPRPDTPYGHSRLNAESAVREELSGSSTRLAIVRVPAVVGIGMRGTVLQRFFSILRWGLFIHPGQRNATLGCIGAHRLGQCLVGLVTMPDSQLPECSQFAENIPWTDMVSWYESRTERFVLRIPLPTKVVELVVGLLRRPRLVGPIQVLSNQTRYRDDASLVSAGKTTSLASTKDDIERIIESTSGIGNPRAERLDVPPESKTTAHLLLFLWLAFFAYSTSAALLFQKLLLPFTPSMHSGSGLLSGDSAYFHLVAVDLAKAIAEQGWASWSPWPTHSATGNAAALAALYYWFGPEPSLIVPVNALLHATSAILLILIARRIVPGMTGLHAGIAAAVLFVIFPSALNWYGQVHKDGYAILGFLLFLLSLLHALEGKLVAASATALAGIALTAFVRPHGMILLAGAAGFAVLCAAVKRDKTAVAASAAVFTGALVLAGTALTQKAPGSSLDLVQYQPYLDPSASLSPEMKDWTWRRSEYLPAAVDSLFERASNVRVNYLAFGVASGASSMIDQDIMPRSTGEALGYLPRALQIGVLAPFPTDWGRNMTPARLVGVLETAVWYCMIPGLLFAFMRFLSIRMLLVTTISLGLLAIESYVTPNLGTLHRVRYPFLFVLLTLGAVGWTAWLPRLAAFRRTRGDGDLPPHPVAEDVYIGRRRLAAAGLGVVTFTAVGYLGLFVRDLLMAKDFGLGQELDAFQLAVVLPMFLINLFAVPINAAVVPVFIRLRSEGEDSAIRWVRSMSARLLLIFGAATCVLGVVALIALASRISGDAARQAWSLSLWLLPLVGLSGVTVFGNAVLNALGKGVYAAAAQLTVPAAAIGGLVMLGDRFGVTTVVAGMAIGQILNLALLAAATRRLGFSLWPNLSGARQPTFLSKQYPVLVVASFLSSTALPVGVMLATRLETGNVASLALGSKVVQFMSGIGMALLVAVVLPYFAQLIAGNRKREARRELAFLLKATILVTVPLALFFAEFAAEITSLLFLGGRMSEADVSAVARVLRFGILQLPFFATTAVFVKFAIASQRAGWILAAAVIGQFSSVAASIFLMGKYGVSGIALGMSVGAAISAVVMLSWALWQGNLEWLSSAFLTISWLLFLALAVCILAHSMVGVIIGGVAFIALFVAKWDLLRSARPALSA